MEPIFDISSEAFTAWLQRHDVSGYRAGQVRRWLFERPPDGFERMTDLPGPLRTRLAEEFRLWTTRVVRKQQAKDGTQKLLLELDDGERIECVLLRDEKGHRTICVSTQVGCAMGCVFCASGLGGMVRNLKSGEIVEQMLQLKRLLDQGERLSHVVVMGMGEPLANLDRLLPALAVASAADGLGISARRITISTVGLPGAIRRLADEGHQYHLAVSLHAPDDDLRNRLVPTNRKVGIQAILAAADYFFQETHRRVTYEYVLLAGINDQRQHADRLAGLLKGRPALVNVIPYNPIADLPYRTPGMEVTARFVEILRTGGLNVQVRHRKGERIEAACGQLRRTEP